jgi:4-amino-4-deoxychorismate lyase
VTFSLIETMRADPATGILRARLHAARLRNSARKLGFADHQKAWSTVLEKAARLGEISRLRLELFADGRFEITAAPFTPQPEDTVWTVRFAVGTRLDSTMPILRHKTSLRDAYTLARSEFSRDEADEVLLLNERGEVCEGTIANVFLEAGDTLITPPLSSGCLAGVLRTSLICERKARVGKIMPGDLDTHTLYVGNSLRNLIRAKLLK